MKKEYCLVLGAAIIVLTIMVFGICIGEIKSAELERICRVEEVLEETAGRAGYVNLGVIDGYAISRRNGKSYDGPAIRDELFGRVGLEVPENSWAFTAGEVDGVGLIRFVTYKGEMKEPITEQEVDQIYLYGVY